MPAPGDQHRDTPASVNPFRDDGPRIAEYTAKEIATLQSRLDKQLGPEYISTRPGNGGGKVHYLAAEKVINLANEVFGFNGWSSSIQNVQIDFIDENTTNGRINLGLSTIVRVTLKDGTFHEDIGYGHCENTKGKAAAFEKAKKEAATDAMKRALRNFGNVLGNCLYDKDYLQKIAKVKVAPSKWDADNLHRHPDYAPIKKEPVPEDGPRPNTTSAVQRNTSVQSAHSAASFGSADFEDDFGGNMFDETDFSHPDEVRLDDSTNNGPASPAPQRLNGQRQGAPRTNSMPQMRPANVQAPPPVQSVQAPQRPQGVSRPVASAAQPPQARMLPPQAPGNAQRPAPVANGVAQQGQDTSRSNASSSSNGNPSTNQQQRQAAATNPQPPQQMADGLDEQGFPIPRSVPEGAPAGFVTSRIAEEFKDEAKLKALDGSAAFNPHADSPSIRRTLGTNPGKSAPVRRTEITGGAVNSQSPVQQVSPSVALQGVGTNHAQRPASAKFVNPSADMHRKIGMPGAPGGFVPTRNGYRPPVPMKRPAMADVTNTHGMEGAPDPKKAKIETAAVVTSETLSDGKGATS